MDASACWVRSASAPLAVMLTTNGNTKNLQAAEVCHDEGQDARLVKVAPPKAWLTQYINIRIAQKRRRAPPNSQVQAEHFAAVILDGIELVLIIRKDHMIAVKRKAKSALGRSIR